MKPPFSPTVSAIAYLFFPSNITKEHALVMARVFRNEVAEATPNGEESTGMWQAFAVKSVDAAVTGVTLGHSRHSLETLREIALKVLRPYGVMLENITLEIDTTVGA